MVAPLAIGLSSGLVRCSAAPSTGPEVSVAISRISGVSSHSRHIKIAAPWPLLGGEDYRRAGLVVLKTVKRPRPGFTMRAL
jgi:hypothetical protein